MLRVHVIGWIEMWVSTRRARGISARRSRFSVLTGLVLAGALGAACGPSAFIELIIDSETIAGTQDPLLQLREIDTLEVTISPAGEREVLLEASYSLTELDHDFPVVVVLEPDDAIAHDLDADLLGTLAGTAVATGAWRFRWKEGHINTVPVLLSPVLE